MHGTLYTILRALVNRNGKDWRKQLPYALFVYRNSIHKATGVSPHQALFGYISRHECLDEYEMMDPMETMDARVKAMFEMREHIKARMEQVEKDNHRCRNIKRNLRHYDVGDQVLLRNHVRHKLETPWRGPYTVVQRIGNVNYELQLPEGDRTHKVVHLQHLKPWFLPLEPQGLTDINEQDESKPGLDIQGRNADPQIKYPDEQELTPENCHFRPMTRFLARHLREAYYSQEELDTTPDPS
jgi:ribosomal protein L21E